MTEGVLWYQPEPCVETSMVASRGRGVPSASMALMPATLHDRHRESAVEHPPASALFPVQERSES